jgi:hypothetical protein
MEARSMVRFGTKSLLLGCVLAAMWLSTFSGFAAGRDVRASVLLVVFVAVGCAAVTSRGKRRAFWAGFFVVMLLCGGEFHQRPVYRYLPNFQWLTPSIVPQKPAVVRQHNYDRAIDDTARMSWVFALSAVVGAVCARIYDKNGTGGVERRECK